MKYSWKLQDFDTNLFGFKTAKIISLTDESVVELLGELKGKNIVYATYRLKASDFSSIHALEKNGFLLVDGTLALELSEYKADESSENIRLAELNDISALRQLAGNVFSGTRFYVDPVILKEKADELYATWIENAVKGIAADSVLIWEENEKILGFVTLQKKGHIDLIAVSKDAQGKGIGRKLVQATFKYFKDWGVKTIALETQTTNIAALRTYQACGFKITNAFLTYRWHEIN
jgi:dTDP-4-amino-4,6-dideoxy-D-galactose acyltransferase